MANLPRTYDSFAVKTAPLVLDDLDAYVLVKPSAPGSELIRIKLSDLLQLFLSQVPTP